MEFKEFYKAQKRMCESVGDNSCEKCPLDSDENDCPLILDKDIAAKVEQIVEQWAKEHPVMTNADKFKEVFGVSIGSYGAPFPSALTIYEIGTMRNDEWLKQEYQPPKGEEE